MQVSRAAVVDRLSMGRGRDRTAPKATCYKVFH